MGKILFSKDIYDFFKEKEYQIVKPSNVVNNTDTVFYSAGIQPLLSGFITGDIRESKKLFIAQPVIRTQYLDSLDEGTSLAFINGTTSCFNLSERDYEKLVRDWIEFFCQIGLEEKKITTMHDYYEDTWDNISLAGKRTFYYYDNLEIGDTTFFGQVSGDRIGTMCDLGFGIERLRWCLESGSYYNLYSDSSVLNPKVKALLSAMSLLFVCNVAPSNKNSGYRARLFSKKLAEVLQARKLNEMELNYLEECIKYWSDWQQVESDNDNSMIINEYSRNCKAIIKNQLINEGYSVNRIDINIPWDDFEKRLRSAGVSKEKIKSMIG